MPLYITQLILPKKQNPTAFVDDMTKDFMNEIHPSPPIGAIGKLTLLQNGLMTNILRGVNIRYVASKRSCDYQQTAAAWFLNRQTRLGFLRHSR